ncbi:MAG: hypothetical protein U1C46_03440 [Bacteroidales bacterium]|nr:hypothetical protein [Bacteroidales bacterium]MDZ4203853.1 hypothetical protein [Bacteroidales bacterium]
MQILGLLIFISSFVHAQTANNPTGSRSAALGGSSVALSDVWASFNNPAQLAEIPGLSFGLNYENRFLIKELGFNSITAVLPVHPGAFGIAVRQFGDQFYNETFAGLAFGRNFGERFNAGIRLDAYHTRLAENYGSRTTVSFASGFSAQITSDLLFAAALFNPLRIKSAQDFDETLPSVYRAGLAYILDDNLLITLEAEKDSRYKPSIRSGVEYKINTIAAIRGGLATNPALFSFGFGLFLGNFSLDISTVKHEVLGYSPNVAIIWQSK